MNSQWAIGGAQLLHPLKAAGTAFNADPSQLVEQYADCSKPMDEYLAKQLDKIPRTVFDYIWVIDFDVARLPPYEGLTRVYADGTTALYRLDHKTRRAAALVVE